jgi:uncharacterized protein (TIGR02302 family)
MGGRAAESEARMKEIRPVLGARTVIFARLSGAILWIEAILAAFWPVATLIGAFLVVALLGIPARLVPLAHVALLAGFGLAVIYLAWRGTSRLRTPTAAEALRRLERTSGARHRPFETLNDRPAGGGDPVMSRIWRLHQDRNRAEIGRLRLAPPDAGLPERDPRALRLLVLIALAFGLALAGPRAGRLIVAALSPNLTLSAGPIPVEAWIKPPAYTGVAPIVLQPGQATPIAVPVGSRLEAHVTGGSRVPRLILGDAREDFRTLAAGSFALDRILTAPETISIRRGWSNLAEWRIDIIPDAPPSVEFAADPATMQSGALRIDYHAADDYGVATVGLRIRPAPGQDYPRADAIAADLTTGQAEKELHGVAFEDLTAHPWAGMTVLARLVATDTGGQTGESAEIPLALPERTFTNQTAQAIIDARKQFMRDSAPRRQITMELSILTLHTELYGGDFAVYLALRSALAELDQTPPDDDQRVADIEDLLWNAALKIEDGDRPEAEKALRAAEDALEKALKDPNTPASEIARLMQNLRDAMNHDLEAMLKKLREQQARGELPAPSPNRNAQIVDRRDLDKALDKMAQLAQQGSRAAAEEMLAAIKNTLENMQTAMAANKANQQGMKAMQALKDLAQKQRQLENANDPNAARSQEALRQALGDTARQIAEAMGDIPKSLSAADKAMRDAARALQRGGKGEAQAAQDEAASQIDSAIQSLSDQMAQQGMSEGQGGQQGRDPFGRDPIDRANEVKVPTDREMQRSRAILDELRKRVGEHDRPRMELDYLRRLLQQF